jgi:hypothetical protein
VDQINVVVPATVQPGCYVSVAAVSGTIVSNFLTLPVAASGGPCTDPEFGIGAAQAQLLNSTGTVNFGTVGYASATFQSFPDGQFPSFFGDSLGPGISFSSGWGLVSSGGCVVSQPIPPSGPVFFQSTGLDAGAITITWPSGSAVLSREPGGAYYLPSGAAGPAAGDAVTIDNGAGGTNIGHFNTSVTVPAASTLTAQTSATPQGWSFSWTGGAPDSFVQIKAYAMLTTAAGWAYTIAYECAANAEAGQFTVPPAVLLALPPDELPSGENVAYLSVIPAPQVFTASGLDWGYKDPE